MKKCLIALCFAINTILPVIAQQPVDFRINASFGFSDPNGSQHIVVNFPGKTAHEIYTMMAVNIGVMYYEPEEVMCGVQDALISVSGHSGDFCRNGDQSWSAKYHLKFIIKDEKVLVLNPTIRELTANTQPTWSAKKLGFVNFINQYWYNRELEQFVSSESSNRALCTSEINKIVNQILGIRPTGIIPETW